GRIGHGAFYSELRKLAERSGVRLASFPAMDDYVRYVLLSDGIRAQDLYRDLDGLRAATYRALASTDEEKALVRESERLTLARKLLAFSLMPEEWSKWSGGGNADTAFLGDLTAFEAFYREAEARNDALTGNVLKAMDAANADVAVLVTGGFHSPGVNERFARAGVATVSYVPRLTKVDFDGSAYLSVFTQEKTPLDKLFEGPKLFLAQNPASAAALDEGAVAMAGEAGRRQSVPFASLASWFRAVTGLLLLSLRQVGDAMRVVFRRGNADVTIDEARGADGKLALSVQSERAAARPLRERLAALATAPVVRETVLNSNVLGLALLALAVPLFGLSLPAAGLVFVALRLSLIGSAIAHESGHLYFQGSSLLDAVRGGAAAVLSAGFLQILIGRELLNAQVLAAPEAEAEAAIARRAAIGGLAATALLAAAGAALFFLGTPAFAFDPTAALNAARLTGYVLGAANLALLLLNIPFGTDFVAAVQGRAVDGVFAMFGKKRVEPPFRGVLPVGSEKPIADGAYVEGALQPGEQILFSVAGVPLVVSRLANGNLVYMLNNGRPQPLESGRTYFIGRNTGNQIVVPRSAASRYSLALTVGDNGSIVVTDLFSRNPPRVTALTTAFTMHDGAENVEAAFRAQTAPKEASGRQETGGTMLSLVSAESQTVDRIRLRRQLAGAGEQDEDERPLRPEEERERVSAERIKRDATALLGLDDTLELAARNGLNADQRSQFDFYKEFIRVLYDKYTRPTLADGAKNPYQNNPRLLPIIARYLDEAMQMTEPERFVRGPMPRGVTGRTGIAGVEMGMSRRAYSTIGRRVARVSLAGNDDLRLSIQTTPGGELVSLGIDRRVGNQNYEPVALTNGGVTMLDGYQLSLADVRNVELTYDRGRVLIRLTMDNGTVRTLFFAPTDLPGRGEATALSLNAEGSSRDNLFSAGKPAGRTPVTPPPLPVTDGATGEVEFFYDFSSPYAYLA
ncbi:MAG: FHA domain-containing protein, partial [Elusimicrobia bacterium]|nr:FHA domain-containing protein [Elusimicrobiota bacterium]